MESYFLNTEGLSTLKEADYPEYKERYPESVDFKPGSDTHDQLVRYIKSLAQTSYDQMKKRFPSWRKIDESLTAYIPLSEKERMVKNYDERKPVSIVVPITYATLETLLTYDVAAFLDSPIFRFSPGGPEDKVGSLLMERVVELQVVRAKMALKLHTMWRGAKVHGLSAVGVIWKERIRKRRIVRDDPFNLQSGVNEEKYGHGDLMNIDPYCFLPDPNVPVENIQDMEYCGWKDRTNYTSKIREESTNENVFNTKYLRHLMDGRSKIFNEDDTGKYYKTGGKPDDITHSRLVDEIIMYTYIIPKDAGLGDSEKPELWFFVISADEVITTAMPVDLDHGMIPIVSQVPNYDGFSLHPPSPLETIYGLQGTIDWMFSSHIANIRKAIHDMFIVDPELINVNDIRNPKPGKIIKLKRSAWGRGLKDIIMQFPVNDVTRQHIPDTAYIKNILEDVSGAGEAVKGIRRKGGERVTATEVSGTMTAALSRLEKNAKITSLQAHYDIAYMLASNTQQFMDQSQYIQMVGQMAPDLIEEYGLQDKLQDGFYKVNPQDLAIDYDVIPHDGTIPGSGDTQAWIQVFQIMASQPQIGGMFDMQRVFKHIARGMGAKNVNDFVLQGGNIQASVQEPGAIEEQVRQGNAVPINEEMI